MSFHTLLHSNFYTLVRSYSVLLNFLHTSPFIIYFTQIFAHRSVHTLLRSNFHTKIRSYSSSLKLFTHRSVHTLLHSKYHTQVRLCSTSVKSSHKDSFTLYFSQIFTQRLFHTLLDSNYHTQVPFILYLSQIMTS